MAITPAPGYMIDPSNANGVIPIGSQPTQPAAQTPATPAPAMSTPAVPTVPNATPVPTTPLPATQTSGTPQPQQNTTGATAGPLAMPANGSVVDLLNAAGADSSFANRSALAQQYGIQGYTGSATQNQDLAKKYLDAFNANKGTKVPDTGAQAASALDSYFKDNSQDPAQQNPQGAFYDAYANMNPVVKNLYDSINKALSTVGTQETFTNEFNRIRQEQGIPELNTQLMNINNVMSGTLGDIRDEITKVGGFATESQVQALAATRNSVLMKQANLLSNQLQTKNDYVNQVVNLTQADRKQVNDQIDRQIGLTEKVATMQTNLDNAARSNYENIVSNIGYDGLANALAGDPNRMRYVEGLLGLQGGALSNPQFIQNAKTLKQQTLDATLAQRDITNQLAQDRLAQGNQRIQISLTGGLPGVSTGTTTDENGNVIETGNYNALTIGRYNKAANAATAILQKNPTFKNILGSSAYLDRIEAAVKNPGSVGDQELLDAFTQLNTGGNRVTEAQVHLITNNQSLGDFTNKINNKLDSGGALSSAQRQEIVNLAQTVYKKYQDSYLPLYKDAVSKLQAQGIPKEFWNIPSPDTLSRAVNQTGGAPSNTTQLTGPDGKLYNVPNNQVDAFLKAGGSQQ